MMQPEVRRKYRSYFTLILAGMFGSLLLLGGPLEKAGRDLAAPMVKRTVSEKASRERIGQFGGVFVVAFLAMTIYGAHIAARFLSDKDVRKKDAYVREVRWSIPDSVMLTFLFLTLPFLIGLLMPGPPRAHSNEEEFTVGDVIASAVSCVVVLLLAIRIVNQKGGSFRGAMGLRIRPRGRLASIGAAAFLGFWPFRLMYTTALLALFQGLRLRVQDHPVVHELSKPGATVLKLSLAFSVAVLAPIFEEIFFRGFLYQALRKRIGPWAGVFATAGLFAVIHPSPFQTSLIFPLGLLLAYLVEKTGSLIPSIVLHFLTNGTTLAMLFLAGG